MIWHRYKDSEVPGSLVSPWTAIAQGRSNRLLLRAGICALTMGNLPSKLYLGVQGWGNLSFTLAVKTLLPLTTMYISALSEFADIPIVSFPGWGVCSICTVYRPGPLVGNKGQNRRAKSRKYSKGRGGKGPHSPVQTLQFPCRLLVIFSPLRPQR